MPTPLPLKVRYPKPTNEGGVAWEELDCGGGIAVVVRGPRWTCVDDQRISKALGMISRLHGAPLLHVVDDEQIEIVEVDSSAEIAQLRAKVAEQRKVIERLTFAAEQAPAK